MFNNSIKTSLNEELILGILSEGPMHGYRIEKIIDERGMRKWTEVGFSSIYYILEKLEKKNLAVSSSTSGKEKKEYSITPLGMDILKKKTLLRLMEREPSNTHFLIGIANGQLIEDEDLKQAFMHRRDILLKDLEILREKEKGESKAPRSARQLFSLSIDFIKTEIEWLSRELEKL